MQKVALYNENSHKVKAVKLRYQELISKVIKV